MLRTILTIAGVAVVAVAGGLYYLYNRGLMIAKKWYEENTEVIDGEVSFDTIVSFLKSINLDKEKDSPFIVKEENEEFKKFSQGRPFPEKKEGYEALFVGVYDNKTEAISHFKVIYAKSFDAQTNEVFGAESLVVLS